MNGNYCRYESMKHGLVGARCLRVKSAKSYDTVRFGGSNAKKITFRRFARILNENGGGPAGPGEQNAVYYAKVPAMLFIFLKDCPCRPEYGVTKWQSQNAVPSLCIKVEEESTKEERRSE